MSLHFPSLSCISVISLHFPSLPFISFQLPSLHIPSCPFISLPFSEFVSISLHVPSFPFIPFQLLDFTSLHVPLLNFLIFPCVSFSFSLFPFMPCHFTSLHFPLFPSSSLPFPFLFDFPSFRVISLYSRHFPSRTFISFQFPFFPSVPFPPISLHFLAFPFSSFFYFLSFPFILFYCFPSFPSVLGTPSKAIILLTPGEEGTKALPKCSKNRPDLQILGPIAGTAQRKAWVYGRLMVGACYAHGRGGGQTA